MNNKVITFGCRLNIYESEVMKDLAHKAGLDNAIIVNTCAVTAEADRQARQSIRKLRRENPDAKIFVTGCGAQINPDQFSAMKEVDRVIGNDDKLKLETYQKKDAPRILVNDIMSVQETAGHLVSGFEGRARAFVQIQNGCNHRCTFCTIPYGRGNSRSVPLKDIITQTQNLVDLGYKEVVVTGVDITDYGKDFDHQPTLGATLSDLLDKVPSLERLRLSSVDSVEMDADLWRLIAEEPRVMPHLHMSLQAGDDMVLKRMKRRHLRADGLRFCEKARELRPDVVFGADIIAGFPTETDDMFDNTHKFIEEAGLTYLHIFPYSIRPGTPAARMPQVEKSIIKRRAAVLREAGKKMLHQYFETQTGTEQNVLIESIDHAMITGKTDHFAPIMVATDQTPAVGTVIKVNVTGNTGSHLLGVAVS
ncbi:MAG TPA: tRNA (N(6)-L-threonylcarbamoyladenosine(37)-C(2))-methylthiotransferase MtaB [Holosporales bacterium]|nr:tRNA (N(6)-L-threonylcarbamoyladenosine(37)-C(2))-methylthiotransferase MtaB [Holosporales bacterium]